jgi:hypothetical protein
MLEKYLHRFANLRTDRGRSRYPYLTLNRAPHKPILLLSVMDLIAQGSIAENFIEPSFELVDTFNFYWVRIMPPGAKTGVAGPFPSADYADCTDFKMKAALPNLPLVLRRMPGVIRRTKRGRPDERQKELRDAGIKKLYMSSFDDELLEQPIESDSSGSVFIL